MHDACATPLAYDRYGFRMKLPAFLSFITDKRFKNTIACAGSIHRAKMSEHNKNSRMMAQESYTRSPQTLGDFVPTSKKAGFSVNDKEYEDEFPSLTERNQDSFSTDEEEFLDTAEFEKNQNDIDANAVTDARVANEFKFGQFSSGAKAVEPKKRSSPRQRHSTGGSGGQQPQ